MKSTPVDEIYWHLIFKWVAGKIINIDSDNGLVPIRCQAFIWTNAAILLIGLLGTNFSEILINSYIFKNFQENTFENVVWKMATILSQPQCVNIECQLSSSTNGYQGIYS